MNRSPLNETQKGRNKTAGMTAAKRQDEGKKKRNLKTSHVEKLKVCSLLMTMCVMCAKIRMVACQENTVMTTGCSAIAVVIGFTTLVLSVEWSIRQITCGNCF